MRAGKSFYLYRAHAALLLHLTHTRTRTHTHARTHTSITVKNNRQVQEYLSITILTYKSPFLLKSSKELGLKVGQHDRQNQTCRQPCNTTSGVGTKAFWRTQVLVTPDHASIRWTYMQMPSTDSQQPPQKKPTDHSPEGEKNSLRSSRQYDGWEEEKQDPPGGYSDFQTEKTELKEYILHW